MTVGLLKTARRLEEASSEAMIAAVIIYIAIYGNVQQT